MLRALTARPRRSHGLTLVELLVAMVIAGVLLAIAGPNLYDFVLIQRLKGVNAELVTDLQLARSEAAARGQWGRVVFERDDDRTCYTIYTSPLNSTRCSCLLGPGAACSGNMREVKTLRVLRSDKVTVIPVLDDADNAAIGFDHISGGLVVIPQDIDTTFPDVYEIDTAIDDDRILRVRISRSGRPTVCSAAGEIPGYEACP